MSSSHVTKIRLLYKTILRLHRGLPPELNQLGTEYVRAEFKRHKKCNQDQARVFMNEWSIYAVSLANQLKVGGADFKQQNFGRDLSEEDLNHFNDDQIVQLYELLKVSKKLEE